MQANYSHSDVIYLAKVRIFQQITTEHFGKIPCRSMSFTLQRYEFFSKSQLGLPTQRQTPRCHLPCKGTNFSANHNAVPGVSTVDFDVIYLAKVRIFQQITTDTIDTTIRPMMSFTLQRYEFFSKSQPRIV